MNDIEAIDAKIERTNKICVIVVNTIMVLALIGLIAAAFKTTYTKDRNVYETRNKK